MMKVYFSSNKMEKKLNKAKAEFGERKGKTLLIRYDELCAAKNLKDLYGLKQLNLHPLIGEDSGSYAITTIEPFRMIITPYNEDGAPISDQPEDITSIMITNLDINYH